MNNKLSVRWRVREESGEDRARAHRHNALVLFVYHHCSREFCYIKYNNIYGAYPFLYVVVVVVACLYS